MNIFSYEFRNPVKLLVLFWITLLIFRSFFILLDKFLLKTQTNQGHFKLYIPHIFPQERKKPTWLCYGHTINELMFRWTFKYINLLKFYFQGAVKVWIIANCVDLIISVFELMVFGKYIQWFQGKPRWKTTAPFGETPCSPGVK